MRLLSVLFAPLEYPTGEASRKCEPVTLDIKFHILGSEFKSKIPNQLRDQLVDFQETDVLSNARSGTLTKLHNPGQQTSYKWRTFSYRLRNEERVYTCEDNPSHLDVAIHIATENAKG